MQEEIQVALDRIEVLGKILNLEKKEGTVAKLNLEINKDGFWNDPTRAQGILKTKKAIEDQIDEWGRLRKRVVDMLDLLQVAQEEGDNAVIDEIKTDLLSLKGVIENLEVKALLSGDDDDKDAIIDIHSGAGGTDAQDWAEMLSRMYLRWAEREGFSTTVLDKLIGDEAGLKSISISVEGEYAYGYLQGEIGVHRLIRLSPFDANHRRHTSFASVAVYPRIDKVIEIKINEGDLRIDTFRATGPGGQSVNTTDSAVRITHLATGISVTCQNERSQLRNKENATILLKAKLYAHYQAIEMEKKKEADQSKKKIEWGSQIRSYTFHPYSLVKDHRTKVETGNIINVMDGDISLFISSFLEEEHRIESENLSSSIKA